MATGIVPRIDSDAMEDFNVRLDDLRVLLADDESEPRDLTGHMKYGE